jgi:hypothetical protein
MESEDVAKLESVSVGRRTFIIVGGASVVGAGTYAWLRKLGYEVDPALEIGTHPRPTSGALPHEPFDPIALAVLATLVDHLIPGDPSKQLPAGRDAGVLDYLIAAARAPGMGALRNEVLKLTRYLDMVAKEMFGAPVVDLHDREREAAVIKEAADNARARPTFNPARALEATLRLALEGYLGHPHHGGNKGHAVWNALSIPMPRERTAHHGG